MQWITDWSRYSYATAARPSRALGFALVLGVVAPTNDVLGTLLGRGVARPAAADDARNMRAPLRHRGVKAAQFISCQEGSRYRETAEEERYLPSVRRRADRGSCIGSGPTGVGLRGACARSPEVPSGSAALT
jgi:hypothetical protein